MPNSATATVTAEAGAPMDIHVRQTRIEDRVNTLDGTLHTFQDEVGKRFDGMSARIERGHAEIGAALTRNSERTDNSINRITDAIAAKGQTNWGLLASMAGVLLAVIGGLATLARQPILDALTDHKASISELQRSVVPREELRLHWEQDDRRYDDLRHTQQRTWDQIDKERDREATRDEKLGDRIDRSRAESAAEAAQLRRDFLDLLRAARK